MENPITPAVEGSPLVKEMENVIIRTQTDPSAEKEVIREDKEEVDMEEEEERGEATPTTADLTRRNERSLPRRITFW